jgi:transcriptional regulator with XRE-family HTH domain
MRFKNIAELVRRKRAETGLSQAEVARKVGYKLRCGQFISNIEREKCSIPLNKINKYSEVLRVSREEIKKAILQDFKDHLGSL